MAENLPFLCIASIFQKDPQVLISHPGVGHDTLLGADRFSGTPTPDQTATLSILYNAPYVPAVPLTIPIGTGSNGPNSPIVVSDTNGTLTLRGPAGSTFTLGQFFNDAGDPLDLLPPHDIPPFGPYPFFTVLSLKVNGVDQPDVLGYHIRNGDQLALQLIQFPST